MTTFLNLSGGTVEPSWHHAYDRCPEPKRNLLHSPPFSWAHHLLDSRHLWQANAKHYSAFSPGNLLFACFSCRYLQLENIPFRLVSLSITPCQIMVESSFMVSVAYLEVLVWSLPMWWLKKCAPLKRPTNTFNSDVSAFTLVKASRGNSSSLSPFLWLKWFTRIRLVALTVSRTVSLFDKQNYDNFL